MCSLCVCLRAHGFVYLEPFLLPVERCAPLRREQGPLQLLSLMHMHTLDSLTQCSVHISLLTFPIPPALIFAAGDIKQNRKVVRSISE